ncbi:DUF5994 family protein [Streptomyces griseorubiginosus]|uniref:DUF5994 family protein n=1 Tax=Streptomyces griseorubiginosus TaxID=67304 RepID=UPI0033EE3411
MEPTAERPSAGPKRLSPPPSVRLSRAPYEAVRGGLDGAWWPYSHSLVDELPVLVEAMGGVGSITRVVLGIDLWPDIPHRIPVGGHFVTVGWFVSGHEQNEILLCSYSEGFRTLLVVHPTPTADGQRPTDRAGEAGGGRGGGSRGRRPPPFHSQAGSAGTATAPAAVVAWSRPDR